MAATGVADAAVVAGSRVGRYFGVLSTIPSALFVLFVYALIESGAWSGPADAVAAVDATVHISFGTASVLAIVTLALAMIVHPLQFAMIQVLEGYWGTGRAARRLAALRIRHHRAVSEEYRATHVEAIGTLQRSADVDDEELIPKLVDADAFGRARERYPDDETRTMPTRLGNVLRRVEDLAGQQYGLDLLTVAPHLGLLAPQAHLTYLDDARTQLDLAVRWCLLSLLAAMITFVALLPSGWSVLFTLVPYALAYIAYRGSVVAAEDYGSALSTLVDLNRFRLYEELHLPMPKDTRAERKRNPALMELLAFEQWPSLAYSRSPQSGGPRLPAHERLSRPSVSASWWQRVWRSTSRP